MELLRAVGLTKGYPGVQALAGVDFDLRAGEVHALVGENGAGKSTLIRLLCGAAEPDSGHIEVGDATYRALDPALAQQQGIAVIHQHPALFGALSVAENLALGLEPPRLWRRVDHRERRRRAVEVLQVLGADLPVDAPVAELSVAQRHLVALARAISAEARVFILDEPTACLPSPEVARLHEVVRTLRERGAGVIYITHRLEELPVLADRVTVLRDGRSVATRPWAELDTGELIRLMVGRDLGSEYPARQTALGDVLLSVRDLACEPAGLAGVSFDLRAGEILGLAGLVGSGRSELVRALFGLTPATSGQIVWRGRPVAVDSVAGAMALGFAMVPEDRRRHGVIGAMSVIENTTLAHLAHLRRHGLLNRAAEHEATAELAARLAVKTPSLDAPVGNLSGGNQQKVALARGLVTGPQVILVDEPTQGVDVGAKAEIHQLLSQLAEAGCALIVVSSEMAEVLGLADRVLVMRGGRPAALLDRAVATPERVLALAFGQEVAA